MAREDRFTNTVEDAATFERMYGEEHDDDRPDWSDVAGDDWTPTRSRVEPCPVTRERDGQITHCLLPLGHLSRGQAHEPNPWTIPADPALRAPDPF